MVSPIPKLRIPAKGASGRSFNPDDIHLGSAQPSKSEKWLKTPIILGLSYHRTCKKSEIWNEGNEAYLTIRISESRWSVKAFINWCTSFPRGYISQIWGMVKHFMRHRTHVTYFFLKKVNITWKNKTIGFLLVSSPILKKLQMLHQMPSPGKQAAKHKHFSRINYWIFWWTLNFVLAHMHIELKKHKPPEI